MQAWSFALFCRAYQDHIHHNEGAYVNIVVVGYSGDLCGCLERTGFHYALVCHIQCYHINPFNLTGAIEESRNCLALQQQVPSAIMR